MSKFFKNITLINAPKALLSVNEAFFFFFFKKKNWGSILIYSLHLVKRSSDSTYQKEKWFR